MTIRKINSFNFYKRAAWADQLNAAFEALNSEAEPTPEVPVLRRKSITKAALAEARKARKAEKRIAARNARAEARRALRAETKAVNCLINNKKGVDSMRKAIAGKARTKATYEKNSVMIPNVTLFKGEFYSSYKVTEFSVYNTEDVIKAIGDIPKAAVYKVDGMSSEYVTSSKLINVEFTGATPSLELDIVGFDKYGNVYAGTAKSGWIVSQKGKPFRISEWNGRLYRFWDATAAQRRTSSAMFVACTTEQAQLNNYEWLFELTDKITYGAARKARDKGQYKFGNLFKTSSRSGLAMSPGKSLGNILEAGFSILNYKGKISCNGIEFMDGMSVISNELVAKLCSEHYGQMISADEALKLCPQFRFSGIVKAFGATVKQSVIDAAADMLRLLGEVEIIGDGPIGVIVDGNNVKLDSDFAEPIIRFLDIAKKSSAHTNVQSLQGLSIVPGFRELVLEIGKTHIDKHIDMAMNAENKYPVSYKAIEDRYLAEVIPQMNPAFARTNAPIWSSIVKNLCNKLQNNLNRLNFDLPGYHLRLLGDIAALFQTPVLRAHECFAPALVPGTRTQAVRNPKAGFDDHALLIVIGISEIERRVARLKLSDKQKQAIVDFYRNLPDSVAVLSCSEEIKGLLGGHDYDYDGATFIADEGLGSKWLDLADKIAPFGVDIVAGNPNEDKRAIHEYDYLSARNCYYKSINSGNLSIGQICNFNSLVMSVLTAGDDVIEKFFSIIRPAQPIMANDEYLPVVTKEDNAVDIDKINEFINRVKNVRLYNEDGVFDIETAKNILRYDWTRVFIGVEGNNIDAAKNDMVVPVPFFDEFRNASIPMMSELQRKTYAFDIVMDRETQKRSVAISSELNLGKRSVNDVYIVSCDLSKAKTELAQYAADKLNEIAQPEKLDDMFGTIYAHVAQYSTEHAVLEGYAKMYHDIAHVGDTKVLKVMKKAICDAARTVTKDIDCVERSQIARLISMSDKYGNIVEKQSNYPSCFEDEMILDVLEMKGSQQYCGEEIILDNIDGLGETVEFVEGVSAYGNTIKHKITGMFDIEQFGDRVFAVKHIADVIDEAAIDEKAANSRRILVRCNNDVSGKIHVNDEIVLTCKKSDTGHYAFVNVPTGEQTNNGKTVVKKLDVCSMYNEEFSKCHDNVAAVVKHVVPAMITTKDDISKNISFLVCTLVKVLDKNDYKVHIPKHVQRAIKPTEYNQSVNVSAYMERATH